MANEHQHHNVREHPFYGHICVDCQKRVTDYKERPKESPFTRRAREGKLPAKELGH